MKQPESCRIFSDLGSRLAQDVVGETVKARFPRQARSCTVSPVPLPFASRRFVGHVGANLSSVLLVKISNDFLRE